MEDNLQRFNFSMPIMKAYIEKAKDGSEKKILEGVASTTDRDLHGDRMSPDAIKSMADSLPQLKESDNGTLNAEHDKSWTSELGDITELTVDKKNQLIMRAELNGTSGANDLWYLLTEKKKKLGLSIGGFVKSYRIEIDEKTKDYMRVFENVVLDHISVVSQPANPNTWVSAIAKSLNKIELGKTSIIGKETDNQVNESEVMDVTEKSSVEATEETKVVDVVEKQEESVSEGEVSQEEAVTTDATETDTTEEAGTEAEAVEETQEGEATEEVSTEVTEEEANVEEAPTEEAAEEDNTATVEETVVEEKSNNEESVAELRKFVEDGFSKMFSLLEKKFPTDEVSETVETEEVTETVENTENVAKSENATSEAPVSIEASEAIEKKIDALTKEVESLKKTQTSRKGVTLEKFQGEKVEKKVSLEEALNKAREEHKNDPALFAILAKVRKEYSA